jgi:hypothetical protein
VGGTAGQRATHPEEIMLFETRHLCPMKNISQYLTDFFKKQEVRMGRKKHDGY